MEEYTNFKDVFEDIDEIFEFDSNVVHTERWQAIKVIDNPAAQMVEYLHHSFMVDVIPNNLNSLQSHINPNLPWADDHFEERVCGEPLNPGTEWANWPWGESAAGYRNEKLQFNHNYMERYWPKYAGRCIEGKWPGKPLNIVSPFYLEDIDDSNTPPHHGIRHLYGDLRNLVELLANEPGTRQAYLPVWFPEDTGTTHNGRKPCTLGYHFIMRSGQLDITYYIRSCDYIRHFKDDIYLTVRLLLWVIDECRKLNPIWNDIKPGSFIMHITSLHMFINDYIKLFGRKP